MAGIPDKDLFVCSHPEGQDERPSSTFWDDFTIADAFGASAVRDTFNRAFRGWRSDYRMLTELVMVLNHKIWQHHEAGREEMAVLYDELWRRADDFALKNLKDAELAHFWAVTD